MIDATNYRVQPDARPVNVEDDDVTFQGSPLTGERINELVAKVDRAQNLTPGGKSLSGDGKYSPVVQVRLPENVRTALAERAKTRGVSISKYTRELIEKALSRSD